MFAGKDMWAVNVDRTNPETGKRGILTFKKQEIPELREGEVLLKVLGSGLNRADILQRRGMYNPPKGETEILGIECVGQIVDPATLKPESQEDQFFHGSVVAGGSYAQFVRVPRNHLISLPKELPLDILASVPEAWLTAYSLISSIGGLRSGGSIFVNAAASSVGQCLIQLAKVVYKCKHIIATASSEEKLAYCYKSGATLGITYKGKTNAEIAKLALEHISQDATGVDAVFDALGGEHATVSTQVLRYKGSWVLYGLMANSGPQAVMPSSGELFREILTKNIKIQSFTLRSQEKDVKAQLVAGFNKDVLPSLLNKTLSCHVDKAYQIDWETPDDVQKIEQAHTRMEESQNIGKMVFLFK